MRLAASQEQSASSALRESALPAQLVLKSIGYKSVPLDGVAFDEARGVIPNRQALLLDSFLAHPVDVLKESLAEDLRKSWALIRLFACKRAVELAAQERL